MSLVVETRPERALYNVGVTLRMVDHVLAELGASPLPPAVETQPAGGVRPSDADVADRVAHALMLVESLRALATHTPERHVHDGLRRELRSILRRLQGRTHEPAG